MLLTLTLTPFFFSFRTTILDTVLQLLHHQLEGINVIIRFTPAEPKRTELLCISIGQDVGIQ